MGMNSLTWAWRAGPAAGSRVARAATRAVLAPALPGARAQRRAATTNDLWNNIFFTYYCSFR